MTDKAILQEVLHEALASGGDFSEIFMEDRENSSFFMIDGRIEKAMTGRDYGAGIRVLDGLKSVYVYTNDTSRLGLLDAADKACSAIAAVRRLDACQLVECATPNAHPIVRYPSSVDSREKIDIIKRAARAARGYSGEITQVTVTYADSDQKVLIANSEGLHVQDRRVRTRIYIQSVAGSGTENQTGSEGPGRQKGFEMFEEVDVEHFAREASRTAVTMLHAEKCPAGQMPVVINNGFGGVIFHEACGHSLEATSVAKGNSVFAGKLGEKIASDVVTAYDDGTIPNAWGSLNIDDEGIPTRKNLLIDKGYLRGYMIDRFNGKRMNMAPTGNSRRQSYRYAPTSRMTNTYIAPGSSTLEEIIGSVDYGLFAQKMGGGSVNPVTGEFNFSVAEGYLIKDGKIDRPVRGASLIGKGSEILMRIDMVGNNLELGQGMCGSVSGSVAANVGQPTIRVSRMTVGGR